MNSPTSSPGVQAREGEFAVDERGCLFDPAMRAMFANTPGDFSAIEALSAMRVAYKGLHLGMERYAEQHGLSEGRLSLMFRLRKKGEASLSDLADGLSVSARNITGLVDHLEKDGLVERVPDLSDRRSVRARLTPQGTERINAIWREALATQTRMAAGFSREDLEQLRHLCLRLVQNARREDGR